MENSENLSQNTKSNFRDGKYATGKRKTSIAKIWLKKGSGKITVNGINYDEYFKRDTHKMQLLRPFEIINQATTYDVKCSVKGGGLTGQVGAMVHGISKALVMFDSEFKSTLKKERERFLEIFAKRPKETNHPPYTLLWEHPILNFFGRRY